MLYQLKWIVFPLLLAGLGLLASIIGTLIVRTSRNKNPQRALQTGTYVSSGLIIVISFILSKLFFGGFKQAIAIVSELVVGVLIGLLTEYYTSDEYQPVREIAPVPVQPSSVGLLSA